MPVFFFFFPQFTLFLETVEPVVESQGSGIFSFVWQQVTFPVEAQWCFLGLSSAADAAWMRGHSRREVTGPFGAEAGQGWKAGSE